MKDSTTDWYTVLRFLYCVLVFAIPCGGKSDLDDNYIMKLNLSDYCRVI